MLLDASTSGINRISRRMIFVFRNNTVEPFFGADHTFSGYDDISMIPDAESYVWWYQVPLRYNVQQLLEELNSYIGKIDYVVKNVSASKIFYAFTISPTILQTIELSCNSLQESIYQYNAHIYQLSKIHGNVKVIDIYDFLHNYSANELIDWKYFFTAQIPYNPQIARDFRRWWQRQQQAIQLQRKKCLVLDLDNTLWAGILGEDGVGAIQMSGDYPGKAYHYWQEGLKELKNSGVMLAICSKNNLHDVEEVWQKRADMLLQPSDFVAMRINWQDKATNLRELADELNIGLDSFVFVDDNPTERELIKQQLPMVTVPDFPEQPYLLSNLYQQLVRQYFSVYTLTDEDREKTKQYVANMQRREASIGFANLDDFIASLDIRLSICPVNDITLSRVAQMTQKTNQFNLTSHRYTEQDLYLLLENGAQIWTLSVADKFGDSGITGCIIITANAEIDTMLLSCRVLGKGIENAFLHYVLMHCGFENVCAQYIRTAKNSLVTDFYEKSGFELVSQDSEHKYYKKDIIANKIEVKQLYTIN